MSKMTQHDLQCPNCGQTQNTMVWDSLNVTVDPDLKGKLFAAEINLFECKQCGKNTFINAQLLYHDMEQKFCIQYYPPDVLDDSGFFSQFKSDGSLALPKEMAAFANAAGYLAKPHIVFDMNEMLRYVAFRDGIAHAKNE